jgi:hypothetical protein
MTPSPVNPLNAERTLTCTTLSCAAFMRNQPMNASHRPLNQLPVKPVQISRKMSAYPTLAPFLLQCASLL